MFKTLKPKWRLGICIIVLLLLIVAAAPTPSFAHKTSYFPKCTTVIFGKNTTADGSVIMAHTEDLGDDDCMHLIYHPRQTHAEGEVIQFANAIVPQVPITYAYTADEIYDAEQAFGVKAAPFTNGINEFGVTLSSNIFFSKEETLPPGQGLYYGDIGQLVMERCKTAREAVDLIAWCVETFGFAGFSAPWPYLTFLVSDPNEGWIVEVTPRHWVAKRCPDDGAIFYANELQIETEWDLACDDLIDYAIARGWYDPSSGEPFNFKQAYGDRLGEYWNTVRESRLRELFEPKLGSITVQDVMKVYRDHLDGTEDYHVPHTAPWPIYTICAPWTHACEIYHLRSYMPPAIGCVMWIAPSSPCCSVFTPIYAGNRGDPPIEWRTGNNKFNSKSAWWVIEQIQRVVAGYENTLENWEALYPRVRATWDLMERIEFIQTAHLEKTAMKLWRLGHTKQALELLTKYTYNRLHINYLIARMLLHWVQLHTLIS
ncbi:MAG: C69 family dipeptidase [Candidatus Bathyarchaeia archaeon]